MAQRLAERHVAASILSLAVTLAVLPAAMGQAAEQKGAVVSFLAPQKATALPLQTLGANGPRGREMNATSPTERGMPSWGAYITTTADSDTPTTGPSQGTVVLSLSKPDTLSFNLSLNAAFDPTDQLQSVLVSLPAFINSSAATLAALVGHNATNIKVVPGADGNSTGITITGDAAIYPGTSLAMVVSNLSVGHAVLNIYTQAYPEPAEPMGCCNNAELKTDGSLEPLNAEALPPDGLRQDHHGAETSPVSPRNALPYHAILGAADPRILTNAGGLVSMLVAPDNSSITYNVTLGGLAPGNEIYNVSVWFGSGPGRKLGWFPYSLYSFASNRLPTPRGGLLAPANGANFTLATGWVGKFIDASPTLGQSTQGFFNDPTFDFGLQQLLKGNVYIVIGTADFPQGELQGHATLGWPSSA